MIFPGTPAHQKILKIITDHYQDDPRIRALTVFGSLARGNWDQYSDLDLDIIVHDDVIPEPVVEAMHLAQLFKAAGDNLVLAIPIEDDGVDIVLESLTEISIRYHHLHTTKSAIIEDLMLITGDLDITNIRQAGLEYMPVEENSPEIALDRCLRYTLGIKTAIERGRYWIGVELAHRIQNQLLEIYALTSGGIRPVQHFEKTAPQALSDLLSRTLPEARTLAQVYENILEILQHELPQFSNHQLALQPRHQLILDKLRNSPNLN